MTFCHLPFPLSLSFSLTAASLAASSAVRMGRFCFDADKEDGGSLVCGKHEAKAKMDAPRLFVGIGRLILLMYGHGGLDATFDRRDRQIERSSSIVDV